MKKAERQTDGFDAALRRDAGRIRADVSPELDRRIASALARVEPSVAAKGRESLVRPWLAGSLAGVGAAAVVMLLVARFDERAPVAESTPDSSLVQVTPEYLRVFREQVPLHAETAELTAPLEEELRDLRSDIEKAREHLERDLQLTF